VTRDVRAAAGTAVGEVLRGKSLNQALPRQLSRVAERDRPLLQQLGYGTLREAPRLLAVLDLLLDKPLRDRDSDLKGLLLVGLYQLDSTRVPDHAAVATTVEASGALKKQWARSLTNAVLRRYLREREQLSQQLDDAAAAAHPAWLYQALQRQWPGQADELVRANNLRAPMTLRVNSARGSRGDYLQRLAMAGIDAHPGALGDCAIYLSSPVDVDALPGFGDGDVSVQDEAAQLAAPLLQAQPGERILDACAAPGGKACHLLELQPGLAELVAMDVDAARLERVQDNLQRLQLAATVLAGDASAPPGQLEPASFDRVLVDAPCSASGVLRRHPDVKLLRRHSDIGQLARQQLDILFGLWPLLRPGGTLLYATCSVLQEENAEVVDKFLCAKDDASATALDVDWGEAAGAGRQVLPRAEGPDGLFYARLRKNT
jgi:16S rRNA (cytosine967-C5)-methyltransferase